VTAPGVFRWLGYAVPVALLIASVLFLFGGSHWWPRPYGFFRKVGKGPDATTLISTLVVVYTFFVAAYGALTPMVVGTGKDALTSRLASGGKVYLRASALVLMGLAVALDLYRVGNSAGDLYTTTMRDLPPAKVYDTAAEFTRYLIINAGVLLFALIIACLPRRPVDHKEISAGKSA
jgi:hypothetical protein